MCWRKDLDAKPPFARREVGAVLPPWDAKTFSATWPSLWPKGSCVSDAGLLLPVTARGLTLLSGLIPPDFMLAPWQTARGRSVRLSAWTDHAPRAAEPSVGAAAGRDARGSLARCSTHAASPPHGFWRARVSVSPFASAREVAGLTTPVYRPFSRSSVRAYAAYRTLSIRGARVA